MTIIFMFVWFIAAVVAAAFDWPDALFAAALICANLWAVCARLERRP